MLLSASRGDGCPEAEPLCAIHGPFKSFLAHGAMLTSRGEIVGAERYPEELRSLYAPDRPSPQPQSIVLTDPISALAVACRDVDVRNVKAVIIGPHETPYEFGFFEVGVPHPTSASHNCVTDHILVRVQVSEGSVSTKMESSAAGDEGTLTSLCFRLP